MLTTREIEEIISSPDKLAEFSSATLVQVISLALLRVRDGLADGSLSLAAVAQFIEAVRKLRADVAGSKNIADVPRMLVNIQFPTEQVKSIPKIGVEAVEVSSVGVGVEQVIEEDWDV